MYKFSYFTQKANEALNLAIKSAQELGHNYIGSEHILLGLLELEDGAAYSMLDGKDITADKVKELIVQYVGRGVETRLSPDDFTPRSKRIIDISVCKEYAPQLC